MFFEALLIEVGIIEILLCFCDSKLEVLGRTAKHIENQLNNTSLNKYTFFFCEDVSTGILAITNIFDLNNRSIPIKLQKLFCLFLMLSNIKWLAISSILYL
jgi:hypothetical protein